MKHEMPARLEVLFSPAEFRALKERDLSNTWCVVFDVLRATSSMVTALGNGAKSIFPVGEIEEAMRERQKNPVVLLAGERNGVRIEADLTGGAPFDLGNSPQEFSPQRVKGKAVVMTTTNGTRALQACAHAKKTLVGSFLNLRATGDWIMRNRASDLLIICSGTHEYAAYEDALAAGALCHFVWEAFNPGIVADSALMARILFLEVRDNLVGALAQAQNGKRLLSLPQLQADVSFCAQMDRFPLVIEMQADGRVRPLSHSPRSTDLA